MKLTLFTISNEQIKEQLSKLQTKVESLETVKDVQDKIISTKDSQISFLNDQIANIWASVSIVVALIGLIASAVFAYVAWLNKQGAKIVKEGEEQIHLANQKIEEAENKIQQANDISAVAQEKLDELEQRQKELNDLAKTTIKNQKIDMSIREIDTKLSMAKNIIDTISDNHTESNLVALNDEQISKLFKLKDEYKTLSNTYHILASDLYGDVKQGFKFDSQEKSDGANHLLHNSYEFYYKCRDFEEELNVY